MIPVSQPCLKEDDFQAAQKAVRSGWISSLGSELRAFEEEFSHYLGIKYSVSCSNGTTALQLAFTAAGIGSGDEVIIPNLTFAAVANSVLAVNATPICVDVDINSWNIDISEIKKNINIKTKAIVIVHSYGIPVDVLAIKKEFPSLLIIEDCAESHGAEIFDRKVGTLGDISTFSFYANKIITTGEGGCVSTSNDELYQRLKILRDHGMNPHVRYSHIMPGFNYRMTNIQGAIGRSQLLKISDFLAERNVQEQIYDQTLLKVGFEKQAKANGSKCVNWLYTRLVPVGWDRDALILHLKSRQIETRPIFKPINSFPYMQHLTPSNAEYHNSNSISARGISLPTFNGISIDQQNFIIKAIKEF
jgi:perosamine synthetase